MIYKFFSNPEFILSSLINSQLWFSRVEDFNDPFEWNFTYKINVVENKEDIKKYVEDNNQGRTPIEKNKILKKYIEHPNELEVELNKSLNFRKDKGVCCFTENENKLNVLMWSHYANSHKGVAFGFSENEIGIIHSDDCVVNSLSHCIFSKPDCRNVSYKNIPPYINPFDNNRLHIRDYEYIKSEIWKYENEIRMVSPKFGLHFYNKQSLKEIIFGIKTNNELKLSVKNTLENQSELSSVLLLNCEMETEKLEMRLNEYKYVC